MAMTAPTTSGMLEWLIAARRTATLKVILAHIWHHLAWNLEVYLFCCHITVSSSSRSRLHLRIIMAARKVV